LSLYANTNSQDKIIEYLFSIQSNGTNKYDERYYFFAIVILVGFYNLMALFFQLTF